MKKEWKLALVICLLGVVVSAWIPKGRDVNVYISVTGSDANDGRKDAPVKSVDKALQIAGKYWDRRKVNIVFTDGIYYLDKPIEISPVYVAKAKGTLTLKAANEGKAVLSGGKRLQLQWREGKNGIFEADVSEDIKQIDQLYVNGKSQRMARYPNAVEGKNVFDIWNLNEKTEAYQDPLSKACTDRWKNPEGAYLHTMHEALWGDMHWLVTGKKQDGSLAMIGGWQNNRPSKMHPIYRMIENVFEELDVPGEWYFDAKKGILHYMPEKGTDMDNAVVEIVLLENLIHLAGTQKAPVRNVHIDGLKFTHTARTFMKNKEPLLRSDWTVYRNGTILFEGAENCSVTNCEFDQVGGNTIVFSNYNRGITVRSCYIHDSGANGVVFVGNPAAVRSPLYGYVRQDYSRIDRTPGPDGNDFPQECRVEDCLITRTGRHEKQTAPVQISMSYRITVSHCSIYDVPRAGINISEGTFGGHVIEYCDVFNTVLETGDHGSFNSWGRDRYWTPDVNTVADEVEKDTILPYLDMIEKNIIRNSRWRCDHGWDIDLDDGSSFYHIYNNILLNRGLKLREGYKRVVKNNIIINSSLHPHVWYRNSDDVVTGNIFFRAYQPALMNRGIAEDGRWGRLVDYNYFLDKESMMKFNKNSCDLHSQVVRFEFADAANGDYTILPGSDVLKAGFRNIAMDFGVRSEKLKAIAKVPVFPDVNLSAGRVDRSQTLLWQGLTLKKIETLGEQSALGYKDLCGLIVLSISNDSPWKNKVRTNDLLIECNRKSICTIDDLKKQKVGDKVSIKVWRYQTEVELEN